uniref:cyclin-dependent kinase n=1 Tax=Hydra vulgaris TaxID=6087 RepID=T2MEA4_HYDVU
MLSPNREFEELSIIGRGAYGTVFKARDVEHNRVVALKRVCISQSNEEKGVPVSTLREIALLKQLDNICHPNIVRVFDAFQTKSTTPMDNPTDLILTIVFEHVDQDLSSFLHNYPSPGLSEDLIRDLMYQLLSGVDYLHINRIIHRDIKPQNVLITKNKQVKIADFGLARIYGFCKLVTSVVVTLWYRAPEVLLQSAYATHVDLWSVGVIMVEMYNRRPLFPGKSDIDQLHKILSIIGTPERCDWPENVSLPYETFINYKGIDLQHLITKISAAGLDLIAKLLVFHPSKRINASTSLAHPFFLESKFASKLEVLNEAHLKNKTIISSNKLKKFSKSDILSTTELQKQNVNVETERTTNSKSLLRVDSGICLSPTSDYSSSQSNEIFELSNLDNFVSENESEKENSEYGCAQSRSSCEINVKNSWKDEKDIKVNNSKKKALKRKSKE